MCIRDRGTGFWLAVLVAAGQIAVNLLADPAVPDGAMTLFFVNNGALFGYALAVVLLVLDAVGAVLWFRGSGFAYNERFMPVSYTHLDVYKRQTRTPSWPCSSWARSWPWPFPRGTSSRTATLSLIHI